MDRLRRAKRAGRLVPTKTGSSRRIVAAPAVVLDQLYRRMFHAYQSLPAEKIVGPRHGTNDSFGDTPALAEQTDVDTLRNERIAGVSGDLPNKWCVPTAGHSILFVRALAGQQVFQAPDGGLLFTSRFYTRFFYPLRERAGMRFNFHRLRHTAGTLAKASGSDLFEVSRFLGHSSTRITESVYVDFLPETGREVADRLDRLWRR